jgi:histidinol-phosphate aminotransferase
MLKPRPGIMDIAPYRGGDAALPGQARVIRLASNESALGPSPLAVRAYRRLSDELHRYPDGGAEALRAAIAARHGLPAEQIVCGAGSDELIALLVRAYAGPGDEVLYSEYGFLMYALAAKGAGATPIAAPERELAADIDALLARVTPRTRILLLANPNNPTGTLLPAAAVRRLQAGLPPDVLLVLDSAYAEYVGDPGYEDGAGLVAAHGNVVMLRTFSKIYGLAALRIGWAYAPPAVVDVLHRLRGPFNTAAPAQAAALAALEDQAHVAAARAHNDRWLPWFRERVLAAGFAAPPGAGNFLLVRFPRGAAGDADAAASFLNARGILPRKLGAYGLGDCLRITVGREDEMALVADALDAFAAIGHNLKRRAAEA